MNRATFIEKLTEVQKDCEQFIDAATGQRARQNIARQIQNAAILVPKVPNLGVFSSP